MKRNNETSALARRNEPHVEHEASRDAGGTLTRELTRRLGKTDAVVWLRDYKSEPATAIKSDRPSLLERECRVRFTGWENEGVDARVLAEYLSQIVPNGWLNGGTLKEISLEPIARAGDSLTKLHVTDGAVEYSTDGTIKVLLAPEAFAQADGLGIPHVMRTLVRLLSGVHRVAGHGRGRSELVTALLARGYREQEVWSDWMERYLMRVFGTPLNQARRDVENINAAARADDPDFSFEHLEAAHQNFLPQLIEERWSHLVARAVETLADERLVAMLKVEATGTTPSLALRAGPSLRLSSEPEESKASVRRGGERELIPVLEDWDALIVALRRRDDLSLIAHRLSVFERAYQPLSAAEKNRFCALVIAN